MSTDMIKDLREKTGAGMMDCKRALQESSNNFDGAIEILRKKGLATAAKKSSRAAAEGLIGDFHNADNTVAVFVEINCETGFVCKTDEFQQLVKEVTELAVKNDFKDMDNFLAAQFRGKTLKDSIVDIVAKIGENIGVRRFAKRSVDGKTTKIGKYIHAGNKLGVIVTFDDPDNALPIDAAREVAMHVAAMSPQFIRKEDVPESTIAKEKEIHLAQMGDHKKPAEILEKIISGKIGKFMSEVCLEDQIFVKDPEGKQSVIKFLNAINPKIRIKEMVRLQVGEGVEKRS
jgi:elongation factor Ts